MSAFIQMPKMLPCPFCGSEDVELAESITDYFVVCFDCEASGPHKYSEEAIDAWNAAARKIQTEDV